jgi:pyridoxine 5-phosphate synthase
MAKKLGVNIDHVATVRQARRGTAPDPLTAAGIAELSGADGITVHLREDRRHIQDRDVEILKQVVQTRINLEMAGTDEMVGIATRILPFSSTLVPEKREEVTTEGGLDVLSQRKTLHETVFRLQEAGILVSLFIDPDLGQVRAAKQAGADAVEIHTGT